MNKFQNSHIFGIETCRRFLPFYHLNLLGRVGEAKGIPACFLISFTIVALVCAWNPQILFNLT